MKASNLVTLILLFLLYSCNKDTPPKILDTFVLGEKIDTSLFRKDKNFVEFSIYRPDDDFCKRFIYHLNGEKFMSIKTGKDNSGNLLSLSLTFRTRVSPDTTFSSAYSFLLEKQDKDFYINLFKDKYGSINNASLTENEKALWSVSAIVNSGEFDEYEAYKFRPLSDSNSTTNSGYTRTSEEPYFWTNNFYEIYLFFDKISIKGLDRDLYTGGVMYTLSKKYLDSHKKIIEKEDNEKGKKKI